MLITSLRMIEEQLTSLRYLYVSVTVHQKLNTFSAVTLISFVEVMFVGYDKNFL